MVTAQDRERAHEVIVKVVGGYASIHPAFPLVDIIEAVAQALAEQRERDAKISESHTSTLVSLPDSVDDPYAEGHNKGYYEAAEQIARAIRRGKP